MDEMIRLCNEIETLWQNIDLYHSISTFRMNCWLQGLLMLPPPRDSKSRVTIKTPFYRESTFIPELKKRDMSIFSIKSPISIVFLFYFVHILFECKISLLLSRRTLAFFSQTPSVLYSREKRIFTTKPNRKLASCK